MRAGSPEHAGGVRGDSERPAEPSAPEWKSVPEQPPPGTRRRPRWVPGQHAGAPSSPPTVLSFTKRKFIWGGGEGCGGVEVGEGGKGGGRELNNKSIIVIIQNNQNNNNKSKPKRQRVRKKIKLQNK